MTCRAPAAGMEISAATKAPKKPPSQSPIDVPTRIDSSTSSGLTLTVRLMITGFSTWFFDLLVGDERGRGDDSRGERVAQGEQDGGDAGQRAADHGQEIDQGDPQGPQQREGDPEDGERNEDDQTGDQRRQEIAKRVAGHRLVDLTRYPGVV